MNRSNSLRVLTLVLVLSLCGSLLRAQTTHVVINTNDAGAGSLRQAVLDAASGDIITFSDILLSGTITLSSGEILLNTNLTIQGPGATQLTISGNNSSRIFNIPDVTPDPIITITGLSLSNGNVSGNGGGIYNSSNNLTLENCTFTANIASSYGGGVFNYKSSPMIISCTFTNNQSKYGSGIHNYYSSTSSTITSCTFNDNNATQSGGGIENISSSPNITGCTFTGNTATSSGGGIDNSSSSSPTITSCAFTGNTASSGGGGVSNSYSSPTITSCIFTNNNSSSGGGVKNFYSSSTITNCIFTGNIASYHGGGVCNSSNWPTIIGCTFTNNQSYSGGGVCNDWSSVPTIKNCIIYSNSATVNGPEIYNTNTSSNPQISHCNIAGCGGSTSWAGSSFGTDLGGNIDADPLFVNAASDVHLQSTSSCINTGSNAAAPATDLDGYFRCGIADMGVYEFQYDMQWSGNVDHDWNNANNWTVDLTPTPAWPASAPTVGNNLIVLFTCNNPVINNPANTFAHTGAITINSGASLTVEAGKCLTVEGPLTNNGTMLLQSDAVGTASLITNSDVIGNLEIQKYITDSQWHLTGIPIVTAKAKVFNDAYLQYFANGNWVEIIDGQYLLSPLSGYSLWDVAKNTTYTFKGRPNTGEVSIPITADYSGWNLLSNPYPSAIDWSVMDDTYGAIYYWDPIAGNYVNWVNGVGTGSPILPAMQGFWVNASVDGDFVINNEARTHSDTDFYYKRESKTVDPAIDLIAFNDIYQDHFHFLFTQEATAGFDLQYDAYKLLTNVDDVPQLFSLSSDKRFSIDRRPECESIELGFSCITSGEFSIMLAKSNLLPEAILEDTKTGTFHDLANGAYLFAYEKEDTEDRFILHMSTTGIEDVQTNTANIYACQKNITIANLENSNNVVLSVYNTSGSEVIHRTLSGAQKHVVHTTLPSGIYVAVLRTNTQVIKQKVHIQ